MPMPPMEPTGRAPAGEDENEEEEEANDEENDEEFVAPAAETPTEIIGEAPAILALRVEGRAREAIKNHACELLDGGSFAEQVAIREDSLATAPATAGPEPAGARRRRDLLLPHVAVGEGPQRGARRLR